METDIILEGFLEAEQVHGVRYIHFIDSSVHPTLIQNVPGWGHAIKKLECANHACRGALERLVQDNPSYKGNGGLTLKTYAENKKATGFCCSSCNQDEEYGERPEEGTQT